MSTPRYSQQAPTIAPQHAPASVPPSTSPVAPARISAMEWLERRSQPYIVITMAIVAVVRGFYIFSDKLVNLAHVPAINVPLSIGTGVALALASELTVTIAGRRGKRNTTLLYNARLALASCPERQRELWEVEVERLREQVQANKWALRIAMLMSLVAAASYLIDSTGAVGFVPFLIASAIAGYVLYLMYYHGVQTDEIPDDKSAAVASIIEDRLHALRIGLVEDLQRMRDTELLTPGAKMAIIAAGLPVPAQRQMMPVIRLMMRPAEAVEPEDETAGWLSMRDIAEIKGEVGDGRTLDNLTRKYRRRASDNAHAYPDKIKLDPVRGWLVEPSFADGFFKLGQSQALAVVTGPVVDATAHIQAV